MKLFSKLSSGIIFEETELPENWEETDESLFMFCSLRLAFKRCKGKVRVVL